MLEQCLRASSYLDLVCIWLLILTLVRNGLFRVYRFLFAYLLVDGGFSIALLTLRNGTQRYFLAYVAEQSSKTILAVFVVLELYQVALAAHPALARFVRDVVAYVLMAAAVIASGGLLLDNSTPGRRRQLLHHFLTFERTMHAWMLVFLLLIMTFMVWFPVQLRKNTVLYLTGFVVYFLARSLGLLVTSLSPELTGYMSLAMLLVASACMLIWTFALRPAGETQTIVVGHRWDPGAMDHLLGQLTAINNRLLRFSRW